MNAPLLNSPAQQVSVRIEPAGSPDRSMVLIGDVDIASIVTALSITASSPGKTVVHLELAEGLPVEFDGMAGVHVHRPPVPLRDFLRGVDPKWLRQQVDAAGFVEHPAASVVGVVLRLAEEVGDVGDGPKGSGEANQGR